MVNNCRTKESMYIFAFFFKRGAGCWPHVIRPSDINYEARMKSCPRKNNKIVTVFLSPFFGGERENGNHTLKIGKKPHNPFFSFKYSSWS